MGLLSSNLKPLDMDCLKMLEIWKWNCQRHMIKTSKCPQINHTGFDYFINGNWNKCDVQYDYITMSFSISNEWWQYYHFWIFWKREKIENNRNQPESLLIPIKI